MVCLVRNLQQVILKVVRVFALVQVATMRKSVATSEVFTETVS